MDQENGPVFSGRVSGGRTTYFCDVRQAVNMRFYISLTESRRVSDNGFEQNRIFVFEESVDSFVELFGNAVEELKRSRDERGCLPDGDAKGRYGRSGKGWTEEEERILEDDFRNGTDADSIAEKLKRSTYAVTLRLEKLGLIEKPAEKEASVHESE